jgi:dockerin type I repeat protein
MELSPRARTMGSRTAVVALFLFAASRQAAASSDQIVNGLFTNDLSGWVLPSSNAYVRTWSDATGYPGPGSVSIYALGLSAIDTGVLRQCVGVIPGVEYNVVGYFRYLPGLGTSMSAKMSFGRYTGPNCDGTHLGDVTSSSTSTAPADANYWQLFGVYGYHPPAGTHSIEVVPQVSTGLAATALGFLDYVSVFGVGVKPGDVNGDGNVDVADVFYLLNYLFSGGPLPVGPADVNNDHFVDVSDAFFLINYLFAGGPVPD